MDARQTPTLPNPQDLITEDQEDQHPQQPPEALIQKDHQTPQDHTAVQDPTLGFVFDGDDLIFSDDAFPSLPDFKCLSSPSPNTSASQPQKSVPTSCTPSSSSSSSSTSSNWPFLRSPDAVPGSLPASSSDISMQPQDPSDPRPSDDKDVQFGMDNLLGGSGGVNSGGTGVDGYDFSVPWDSDELFPLTLDESGACSDQTFNLDQLCPGFDETNSNGAGVEGEDHKEESDDLAKFFLEWLKNNKDAISPEDLRSIRLKKSTIESAARRLGPDRRGRMQLVKLILSWVQNHHLQRKKARLQEAADQPRVNSWFNPTPLFNHGPVDSVSNTNPNPNMDLDMSQVSNGCNSWLPTTDPYNFQQSCTTNSAVANSQLYSPVSDLHATDPNMSWDQSYNAAFAGYPMTYQAGLQAAQYGAAAIGPLYHQSQSMASATKEARRKRMARQRRLLSLQQSRALGQGDNPIGQGNSGDRNWAFLSSLAMNTHQGNGMVDLNLLPGGSMYGSGQHDRGFLRQGGSTLEKRQGFKSYERNLRFLLQKVLKQSDVGSLGRIVLPKKEAEIHLPELDSRDGITIPMEDIATSRVWNMRYRFWPNNKSRMYLLENTGDFVRSNRLEEGDFIVIYSDVKSGKYMIRGVKVKPSPEIGRAKVEEKRTSSERSREDSTSSSLNLSKVKAVKC